MRASAHTLVELLCVVAVCGVLLGALAAGLRGSAQRVSQSMNRVSGLLDQARAFARVRQRAVGCVVCAPDHGHGWRMALCELQSPGQGDEEPRPGGLLGGWLPLETGWQLLADPVEEACNPLLGPPCPWVDVSGEVQAAEAWIVGFNEFGRLSWPAGDRPIVLRLSRDRTGSAVPPDSRAPASGEQWIWVGRSVSRSLWIAP